MIESKRLLVISDELISRSKPGAPSQTSLRRAVSTAYYALFHHIIRSAANTLVGAKHRKTPRYALIYRSFEHMKMRKVSELVDKPNLGEKAKKALGMNAPLPDIRDIATAFATLQQRRHWADYDPAGSISRSDAHDLVEQADLAMKKLDGLPVEDRKNLLIFMMTSSRD